MKNGLAVLAVTLGCVCLSWAEERPASTAVPKGTVTKYTFEGSAIFPGTVRDYWVYVPAQYDGAKPACVHVNQDNVQFNLPAVMDRLIASREMPVTVGVFVSPGKVKALSTNALDRFNRSFEYDGVGDAYARFLLNELLPHVARELKLNLSTNGNDRSIGGSSSGAICAFTAAWERPDAFTRVLSAVGTYVGLRGGNDYPTLIRKTEPKALRVFLQDGSADLNSYCGDWWMANQEMERALVFAGYEVNHVWGDGGHNGKQMTEVCEDAMRWLWKGWPAPIQRGQGSPQMKDILLPGENWQWVGSGCASTAGLASNAKGEVFFSDNASGKRWKIGIDGVASAAEDATPANDLAGTHRAVRADGSAYVTASDAVWLVRPNGEKALVDSELKGPSGVALTPDQSLLYVCDSHSRWIYSYQVQPDGSLRYKQRYGHLHLPDTSDESGANGMRCDRDGRLYVATAMGIQVCDQIGRVNCILPTPNGRCADLCFGGQAFDTLFATCGDSVFKRKLNVRGLRPADGPLKPKSPKL
jgi:enterochelin esterase-like enzyme